MKIAIVDDEQQEAAHLLACIQEHISPDTNVQLFASGEAFLEIWQPSSYDLIILDIFMTGMTGIDTAREIRKRDSNVDLVFCTTSNEFASESYDVEARDYLLKPYTKENVIRMLQKLHLTDARQMLSICLPDGSRLLLKDYLYAECVGHNMTIHLRGGSDITCRMTLKQMEELLRPYPAFVCCAKGVIIHLEAAAGLQKDGFILHDGRTVPVSRRRMKEMTNLFADYQFQQLRRRGS